MVVCIPVISDPRKASKRVMLKPDLTQKEKNKSFSEIPKQERSD
jgi:hypothetical protein